MKFTGLSLKNYPNNQSGVTLLLALLVLSIIMAISFSLATILFVEVRTSGDLIRTEPAIYAANAVSEEALYKFRRQLTTSGGQCDPYYSQQIGSVSLTTPCPVESSTADPVQQIRVLASSNTFANTASRYPVYTSIDDPKSNYSKIIVTYPQQSGSGNLGVYVCQFDINYSGGYADPGPACSSPGSSNTYWDVTKAASGGPVPYVLTPNSAVTFNLDPDRQQEIILVNSSGANDIFAQLSTFDRGGAALGLPYFGKTSVEITGSGAGVSRKIKVVIPGAGQ